VIEPLSGYLKLASMVDPRRPVETRASFARAWNFGPRPEDALPVHQLVEQLICAWGSGRWEDRSDPFAPPESHVLRLCIDRSLTELPWAPRWSIQQALNHTVSGTKALRRATPADVRAVLRAQLLAYGAMGMQPNEEVA
jgi:CDP-glucose 4,6-dehydratase